jgi:hypothetical protein
MLGSSTNKLRGCLGNSGIKRTFRRQDGRQGARCGSWSLDRGRARRRFALAITNCLAGL